MRVHLASSGGVGGLRIEGQLDTEDLPSDLAAHARRLVELAGHDEEAAPRAPTGSADALQYELSWLATDAAGHQVSGHRHWSESTAPDDAVESLQALVREIVRRKNASRAPR